MVETPEVMLRRRRDTWPQSPPKVPIPVALEAPQVLPSIDIEEVKAVPKAELESKAIMSGVRETKGLSKEEAFNKDFYDLTDMVRVLYEKRKTRMIGYNSKSSSICTIFIILIITNSIIFHFHHKNCSYSFKNTKRKNSLTQIGHYVLTSHVQW